MRSLHERDAVFVAEGIAPLPLTPAAMTLELVPLYRDLLAAAHSAQEGKTKTG